MKTFITLPAIVFSVLLLTGFDGFWKDSVEQVGKTSVYNTAIGSDVHLIQPVHRHEAEAMVAFAETYNRIAYNSALSQSKRCTQLEEAGIEALKQREKSFADQYEVTCKPATGESAPELVMTIWPQVRHSYRFIITYRPTP